MAESYSYDVEILHLLVSPGHAYFGRARDGAAEVPTTDAEQVDVVSGRGIVGDRFFGKAAHMDAAVTLIAVEALEAMAEELGVARFDPLSRDATWFSGAPIWLPCWARNSPWNPVAAGRANPRGCCSAAGAPPTRAPGWTRSWLREPTPPCVVGVGCAASRFRPGRCIVAQLC